MVLERGVDLFLSGAKVPPIDVLVVGGGITGFSTARFLADVKGVCKGGGTVTLTDTGDLSGKEEELKKLKAFGVSLELGGHLEETFLKSDLIVVSPGVPLYIDEIAKAKERGVRVLGELELAFRFIDSPFLAITGTNGKTTTTALLGDILTNSGIKAAVGGNIGEPLVNLVEEGSNVDYIVAEISSFQLEAIEKFRPQIGVLLNISPDHLDRYPGYDEYIEAKMNLFLNQTEYDFAVLNGDDLEVVERSKSLKGKKIFISREKKVAGGVYLEEKKSGGRKIVSEVGGEKYTYDLNKYFLKGVHNAENIMAAVGVSALVGCGGDDVDEAIMNFRPALHRLELVLTSSGVSFYNDSKATNVGAALKSIESFDGGIHLIMGGVDKGGSYAPLISAVKKRVKGLYLLGEAREKIEEELGGLVPTQIVDDMKEVLTLIEKKIVTGDVVLLAPACSSFDMYESYKARGEDFKKLVKKYFGNKS
jgi:UDP-N-acetylmuramoylalanine--D-glutamate ligase